MGQDQPFEPGATLRPKPNISRMAARLPRAVFCACPLSLRRSRARSRHGFRCAITSSSATVSWVGLAGDGDKDPVYTKQSIANMFQRYGITCRPQPLSKNVAVVMVTADIPAFEKPGGGSMQVASMGAITKSLQGGVLQRCWARDTKVYAWWHKDRFRLAASRRAGRRWRRDRYQESSLPWRRSSAGRWWKKKFQRRLSARTSWNCSCGNRVSPRLRASPPRSIKYSPMRRRLGLTTVQIHLPRAAKAPVDFPLLEIEGSKSS